MPRPADAGGLTGTGHPTALPHRQGKGDFRRTVRLFRRFMGSPKIYLVGVLLLVVEAATAVVEPWPIAYLIDFLTGAGSSMRDLGGPVLLSSERFETILILTAAIVLIAAINKAADSLTEVCMARGGRSFGYSIRVAMYSHLQRLPLAYHDKKRTGDVLTRVTGDVLVLEDFIVKSVSNILGSLLVLVGSFTFLLFKSWNVALVAVVVIPMLAFVSNHYSRRIKTASKTQRSREGELASTAQEMLTSIRLVQSYGRGTVDLERFSDQTEKSMRASVGAANIQAQFSFVIALVEALSISAVIWLGVWLVDRNAITIGTLVLFVLLLQNMFKPARKIVSEWYKIGKVFASVERIEDLLDREVVVQDLPGAAPAPALQGRLTFRHVSFAYPAQHEDGSQVTSRPAVLRDIDFEVAPGEVVSLVGFSGAGKSTIAQLVPRLYDPDEGEVLVDGLPLRDLTLASLRAQVSVVLQETVLLSGSVAENIGYGIADATPAHIEAAARMANAHDFIMALPDGYATQLGERGSTLSGGQRQRLAIARAFIRKAPILILDEPTTGLDAESAESVVSALRSLMHGKTTIVISHDLGLIRHADRVIVIAAGQIVEAGRHEELLGAGGPYANLYSRQFEVSAHANGHSRRPVDAQPTSPVIPGAATDEAAPQSRPSVALVDRLRNRLPGLAQAMDEVVVADHVEKLLLNGHSEVEDVSVGKLWVRRDGTCSLRYRLRLSDGSGAASEQSEHSVLGRVHPDGAAAADYLANGGSPGLGASAHPPQPWQTSGAVVRDAGLALHPFPVDPSLPTLRAAMDPEVVSRLVHSTTDAPPVVEVVHYPREGPCVLRYSFSADGDAATPTVLYGKVYRDDSGEVVDGFLRGLARKAADRVVVMRPVESGVPTLLDGQRTARFPIPVIYAPSLRLLVTEGLPGAPVIPPMLKVVLTASGNNGSGGDGDALRRILFGSGQALAGLHRMALSAAPTHSASTELENVQQDLHVVADIWPEVADQVRARLDQLTSAELDSADVVLSHGDFTPAQVLLEAGTPAVVDLDTLCWADPALDLGRFLAHLELRAAKFGGDAAVGLVEDLTGAFLAGYCEETTGMADPVTMADRIAFYRATTLARSALHACRQLKDHRLELALSLLDSINPRAGRVAL